MKEESESPGQMAFKTPAVVEEMVNRIAAYLKKNEEAASWEATYRKGNEET